MFGGAKPSQEHMIGRQPEGVEAFPSWNQVSVIYDGQRLFTDRGEAAALTWIRPEKHSKILVVLLYGKAMKALDLVLGDSAATRDVMRQLTGVDQASWSIYSLDSFERPGPAKGAAPLTPVALPLSSNLEDNRDRSGP